MVFDSVLNERVWLLMVMIRQTKIQQTANKFSYDDLVGMCFNGHERLA